jgi:ABC-2 type transport system permease protein
VKTLAIAGMNLRRTLRDRTSLFFVFVLPLLMVLVIGAAFGGDYTPRLGVVTTTQTPLTGRLITALRDDNRLQVEEFAAPGDMLTAVEHGTVQAGIVIPADYDTTVRSGGTAAIQHVARPGQNGQEMRLVVQAILDEQQTVLRAAGFAAQSTGMTFDAALAAADAVSARLPRVEVRTETTGEALFPDTLGRFDLGASSQLLLFVFLTSLTGSVALIETRRLGISRRMLATPTSPRTIVAGEALGRVAVALGQGLVVILGSSLLFGVHWGDPLAASALLVMFALVAGGAGMVTGATFRTEQQAGGIGILLGLGLAALGGCMVPIEFFSGPMRTVAFLTPHAWANEGFAQLVRHHGVFVDILPQLGVLAAYAVVLFLLGSWLLRRTLTR